MRSSAARRRSPFPEPGVIEHARDVVAQVVRIQVFEGGPCDDGTECAPLCESRNLPAAEMNTHDELSNLLAGSSPRSSGCPGNTPTTAPTTRQGFAALFEGAPPECR